VTDNRRRVLEVIGNNNYPLSASDIFQTLQRSAAINRVTVYRILDLLVAHGLVERISTGGRAAYFGLAPNEHHRPHPHFYCKRCGQMECLNPESLTLDSDAFGKTFPGPDRQGGSSPGRHLQELHALTQQGLLFPDRMIILCHLSMPAGKKRQAFGRVKNLTQRLFVELFHAIAYPCFGS
jgi:Fur family ferric uptake transcriptional regulator